jgi:hypothetical protein
MSDTMPTVENVIAEALTKLSVWTEHDLRVRSIATALREAGMVREWEPIETIPQRLKKQRFEIIGHDARTGTSHVTYWTEYDWYDPDQHYYSEAPEFKPTHWLILQPTPSPEGV